MMVIIILQLDTVFTGKYSNLYWIEKSLKAEGRDLLLSGIPQGGFLYSDRISKLFHLHKNLWLQIVPIWQSGWLN